HAGRVRRSQAYRTRAWHRARRVRPARPQLLSRTRANRSVRSRAAQLLILASVPPEGGLMRNRLAYVTTIAALAAFGFACSEPAHEREQMAEGNSVRGQNQRVALEGCVQPSGDGFALTN